MIRNSIINTTSKEYSLDDNCITLNNFGNQDGVQYLNAIATGNKTVNPRSFCALKFFYEDDGLYSPLGITWNEVIYVDNTYYFGVDARVMEIESKKILYPLSNGLESDDDILHAVIKSYN